MYEGNWNATNLIAIRAAKSYWYLRVPSDRNLRIPKNALIDTYLQDHNYFKTFFHTFNHQLSEMLNQISHDRQQIAHWNMAVIGRDYLIICNSKTRMYSSLSTIFVWKNYSVGQQMFSIAEICNRIVKLNQENHWNRHLTSVSRASSLFSSDLN